MDKRLKLCLDFSGILVDDYEPTRYCLENTFGKLSKYFYNGFVKNGFEYLLYKISNKFLRIYFLLKRKKLIKYIKCMETQNIKVNNSILEKILYLKERYSNIECYIISLQHEKIIYKALSKFEDFLDFSRIYGLEEILKIYDKDLINSKINILRKIGCDIYVTDDPDEKEKIEKNYKNVKVFLMKSNYFNHRNLKYNKIEDIEEYITKIFRNKFNF